MVKHVHFLLFFLLNEKKKKKDTLHTEISSAAHK